MDRIVLQPCRTRAARFVPIADENPIAMSWEQALEKLVPSGSSLGRLLVRRLKYGDFVGLRDRGGRVTNFVLSSVSGGSFAPVLKQQPEFRDTLLNVFQVIGTEWDAKTVEPAA
jgi:hypothetical protein